MINSAEEFIALADSDNPETRSRSLTESASIQVWERVISSYGDYETHILRNITIPMRIIETLANSKQWKTRHAVARKRKSGSQILTILSHDEEPLVRQAVAANKKHP
ncbi:hypothetical protein ACIQUF_19090 [Pseudomonas sp. NPDC090233]|uniref:hypothetical protein n=1 Tax=Pseudomonas sp. NPDC090233 TaxID=3364479 RepID=UPI00383B092E